MGVIDLLKSAFSKVGEFDRQALYGPNYREKAAAIAQLSEVNLRAKMLDNEDKFQQIQRIRQQMEAQQANQQAGAFNNAVSFGSNLDTTPTPGFVSPTNPDANIEDVDPNNILHKPGEGVSEPDLPSFIKSQIQPADQGALGAAIRVGRANRKKAQREHDLTFESGLDRQALADESTRATIGLRHAQEYKALREPTSKADNETFTPQGLDIAAVNYIRAGGAVPPRSSPGLIRQIVDRAGSITDEEIQSVLNAGRDLAGNKATLRADAGSLSKVTANRDAVQSAEKTVDRNIEVLKSTLGGISETGVPILNKGVRWWNDRVLGDPDQKVYQSAYEVVQPEVAKLLTSPNPLTGVLTDTAREEIRAFMSQDATTEQTRHVLDLLEKDRANRLLALDETVSEVKGRVQPSKRDGQWVKDADGVWRQH